MVHGKQISTYLSIQANFSLVALQFGIRNKVSSRNTSIKEYSGTETQSTCVQIERFRRKKFSVNGKAEIFTAWNSVNREPLE